MAIENKVFLDGQIQEYRKMIDASNSVKEIIIGLYVMRRPQSAIGNQKGVEKTDIVLVHVREKAQIEYLLEKKIIKGDFLQVVGVYCTLNGQGHFTCKCGAINLYTKSVSFVHPLWIRTYEVFPKKQEIVKLTPLERISSKDRCRELLQNRQTVSGQIVAIKELEKDSLGQYQFLLTIRENVENKTLNSVLKNISETSNHVYMLGNLCDDPLYHVNENGGRVCSYQLGINRAVFLEQDGVGVRADYPWIKSVGQQAEQDHMALHKGSLVWIDGSIQARKDVVIEKTCETCGEMARIKRRVMEIVPYHVEYCRDCNVDNLEVKEEFNGHIGGTPEEDV